MAPPFALLEQIIDWIDPAVRAAGYWIIGGAVALERSIFIGLVVPGDVVLALGGVYAGRGELDLTAVIVLGSLAAIGGESAGYWLGRRSGESVVARLPLVHRLRPRLAAAREHFERRGGATVAIGRYATAAGAFIPFVAGMSRMPYPRFLAFDVPAVAVWAAGITLVGYAFGENLALVERLLSRFGWLMLGVLAAYLGGRILLKRRRERIASRS